LIGTSSPNMMVTVHSRLGYFEPNGSVARFVNPVARAIDQEVAEVSAIELAGFGPEA
jgi:hypothetical protein